MGKGLSEMGFSAQTSCHPKGLFCMDGKTGPGRKIRPSGIKNNALPVFSAGENQAGEKSRHSARKEKLEVAAIRFRIIEDQDCEYGYGEHSSQAEENTHHLGL